MFASKQLHHFISTAQLLCLTKSAERLCMTASPLGRSIARLEERLGYKLFIRMPNGLHLTARGEALYRELQPYYLQLIELEKNYLAGKQPVTNTLKIATDGMYSGFCTTLADKLSALSPPQYLQMQILSITNMGDDLKQQQVDICIVSSPLADEKALRRITLPTETIKLAVSTELATCNSLDLMRELPLAQYNVLPHKTHTHRVHTWLRQRDIPLNVLRFSEMSQRLRMVEQGLAVSLVAESVKHMFHDVSMCLLDLPADFPLIERYIYCLEERYTHLEDALALLLASAKFWLTPYTSNMS